MSRVHPVEDWADDDVLSPDEPNPEIANLVSEINGHVDRDNLDTSILTGAKVALDAFHGFVELEGAGTDSVVRDNADTNRWVSIESGTLTTDDGVIKCSGWLTYDVPDSAFTTPKHVEMGLRVDGEIACRSGSSAWLSSDTLWCEGSITRGPGAHKVEIVVRVTPGEYITAPSASLTVTVNARNAIFREPAR